MTAAAKGLVQPFLNFLIRSADRSALRELARSGPIGGALRNALTGLSPSDVGDDPLIARIESGRSALLGDDSPLVDDSLGPAGIYDDGQSIGKAAQASRKPGDSLMLYNLVREFHPRTILELGTNLGVSSAYLAAAQTRNAAGEAFTLDASPYRQRVARKLHEECGLSNIHYVAGLFSDTVHDTLANIPLVDLAFIDGHHQYQPTLDYFTEILGHSAPECVFIFDDINWSDGMRRAWSELRRDPRFTVVADLNNVGIGITTEISSQLPVNVKIRARRR